jgi:hypothetical protein
MIRWITNLDKVEIDITYRCNLGCYNCSRSCGNSEPIPDMTIDQIKRFIDQTKAVNKQWKMVSILGGEPTLHPDIIEIATLLSELDCKVLLVTNGLKKDILSDLNNIVKIKNTEKTTKEQVFNLFNIAPIDTIEHSNNDYTQGCWITQNCGIGLNVNGYYPCAAGASIDTFLGLGIGKKSIPDDLKEMENMLNQLCRYCGHFNNRTRDRSLFKVDTNISKTWKKLYKQGRIK